MQPDSRIQSLVTALLTATVADPAGYGRILRDDRGCLAGVVEHKDATEDQRRIAEINTGVLAAPAADPEFPDPPGTPGKP